MERRRCGTLHGRIKKVFPSAVQVLVSVQSETDAPTSTRTTTQFTTQNQPAVSSNGMTQLTMVYLRASAAAGGAEGGASGGTINDSTYKMVFPIHSTMATKSRAGLSLVSTLWILTILSVLAAQLLYSIP